MAATADAVLAAATRVLRAEGAAAVSMRRVGAEVGVSAMAAYRHFPNRDALIARIADDGFAALATRAARRLTGIRDPRERLRTLFAGYRDFALKEPHWYDCMFADVRSGARRFPDDFVEDQSPTASLVAAALEDGMQAGAFRRADAWTETLALAALAHGLVALYRGGRIGGGVAGFKRLYLQVMDRHLDGLAR